GVAPLQRVTEDPPDFEALRRGGKSGPQRRTDRLGFFDEAAGEVVLPILHVALGIGRADGIATKVVAGAGDQRGACNITAAGAARGLHGLAESVERQVGYR